MLVRKLADSDSKQFRQFDEKIRKYSLRAEWRGVIHERKETEKFLWQELKRSSLIEKPNEYVEWGSMFHVPHLFTTHNPAEVSINYDDLDSGDWEYIMGGPDYDCGDFEDTYYEDHEE